MRELLLLILVVFMVSGCKKAIEQAQENIILDAMTNGVWVVDEYLQAGTSIKNDFSPYRFQFKKE